MPHWSLGRVYLKNHAVGVANLPLKGAHAKESIGMAFPIGLRTFECKLVSTSTYKFFAVMQGASARFVSKRKKPSLTRALYCAEGVCESFAKSPKPVEVRNTVKKTLGKLYTDQ